MPYPLSTSLFCNTLDRTIFGAAGALGIANIWLAIFGDVGVLVLAVLNAMRASGFK